MNRPIEQIPWEKLDASNVNKVRFLGGEMDVEFHDGSVYTYFDVPLRIFARLKVADMPGKYFFESIRDIYKYTKRS